MTVEIEDPGLSKEEKQMVLEYDRYVSSLNIVFLFFYGPIALSEITLQAAILLSSKSETFPK